MGNDSFTLEAMITDPTIRAQRVPAEALFSWRKHSVNVPHGWLAMVIRADRDALVVAPGGQCDDKDAEYVLFVRETPLECEAGDDHLRTRDGYIGKGRLRCRVRILPEPAELSAFAQTLLGPDGRARDDAIHAHLTPPLRTVLAKIVGDHDAESLISGLDSGDVRKLAEQGLSSACLVAGLTLDGPVGFTFDSDDYRRMHRQAHRVTREKQRHAARSEIQRALARAQAERLGDVVSLLEKMQAAADQHANVDIGALLKTFDPAERGELYAALWHIDGAAALTEAVAVAAGQDIILLPVHDPEHPGRTMTLPEDLGPLRSVQGDDSQQRDRSLLIGTATGAWVLDIDTGQVRHRLTLDLPEERQVRGGFNAITREGDQAFGSHSELGVTRWIVNKEGDSRGAMIFESLTQHADAVRGAQVAEGVLWFIVDDAVHAWRVDGDPQETPVRYGGSNTILTALCVHDNRVYAGNIDGEILAWIAGDPESAQVIRGRSDGMVESIDVQTAGGITQLIIADRRRGLATIAVEDGYELRHASHDQIVRRAVAAPDVLAAMNDARDRIIIWRSDRPREPSLSANIDQLTGHRVQDLCLVPMKV